MPKLTELQVNFNQFDDYRTNCDHIDFIIETISHIVIGLISAKLTTATTLI